MNNEIDALLARAEFQRDAMPDMYAGLVADLVAALRQVMAERNAFDAAVNDAFDDAANARDAARRRAALLEQRFSDLVDAARLGRLDEVERLAAEVLG